MLHTWNRLALAWHFSHLTDHSKCFRLPATLSTLPHSSETTINLTLMSLDCR